MADSMPWFRWYCEAIYDRKLRRLEPAHRWLWIAVCTGARQSPTPGVLLLSDGVPLTADDLADMAAIPVPSAVAGLEAFRSAGMLTDDAALGAMVVPAFTARQYESDNSTTRTRAFRERQRQQGGNVSGTPSDPESDPDTEPSSSSVLPVDRAVLEAVADLRMTKEQAAGKVRTPARFRAAVLKNLPDEIGPRVRELNELYDEPPARIAEAVEKIRPTTGFKKRNPDPREATA
jgi:hypothetical protein